ncbi:LacI family DNA-binding transcriptional regulator [Escherichia fergusonii]|nr:LacI family DNA-binding transcriptional regulator [Escherichia fergusonii]
MTRDEKTKKTTIYDLAELTGVSASAVSAILNGNWKKRRISAKLAEKVTRIAEEQGYAVNRQASLLRSKKSNVIGMIVPKYDNRYFGSIAEKFEEMARARGLLPIITCTRRQPELEIEAARAMLSWQVDWVIATGATQPDKIAKMCQQAGVPTLNLDLPGTLAPSIISDNYMGAKLLTERILANSQKRYGKLAPLIFVGGRISDNNTAERLRGFVDAHQALGITVPDEYKLVTGYSSARVEGLLKEVFQSSAVSLHGLFVNSTISLEGVVRWLAQTGQTGANQPPMGCFDWDPFVSLLGHDIDMVRQDVPAMLEKVFEIVDSGDTTLRRIEIPPQLIPSLNVVS